MPNTEKRVFDTGEAADYLGCDKQTIRRLARQKEIKHYRIGKKIMFRKVILDNWIERQENASISV